MTDTNTLAPCPFCGERAETDFIPEHHSYQIECSDSIGCTARITRDSELGAIEAWNCRAALAAPAQAAPASQPAAVPASGPVGFDHKTAANFLNGKTVTDEEVRRFVAHSRWAHDDRDWLRDTIADLRREIARRDAEIALLKTSLLDAEARQPLTDEQRLTKASKDISTVLRVEGLDLEIGSRRLLREARDAIDAAIAAQQGGQ